MNTPQSDTKSTAAPLDFGQRQDFEDDDDQGGDLGMNEFVLNETLSDIFQELIACYRNRYLAESKSWGLPDESLLPAKTVELLKRSRELSAVRKALDYNDLPTIQRAVEVYGEELRSLRGKTHIG